MICRNKTSISKKKNLTFWTNKEISESKNNNRKTKVLCLINMDLWLLETIWKEEKENKLMMSKMLINKVKLSINSLISKRKLKLIQYIRLKSLDSHSDPTELVEMLEEKTSQNHMPLSSSTLKHLTKDSKREPKRYSIRYSRESKED